MSTPQEPPPTDGGTATPAEPPAWGQQPPGGWGAPQEPTQTAPATQTAQAQQRPGEETRAVPATEWGSSPQTSVLPPATNPAAGDDQAAQPTQQARQTWGPADETATVRPAGGALDSQTQRVDRSAQTAPYAAQQSHYGTQQPPPAADAAAPTPVPSPAGAQPPNPQQPANAAAPPYTQQGGPYGGQHNAGSLFAGHQQTAQPAPPQQAPAFAQQPGQHPGQPQFGPPPGYGPPGTGQPGWGQQPQNWGQQGGPPQWGQQPPPGQWGPGGPQGPPPAGGKPRPKAMYLGVAVFLAVIVLVAVLGLIWPGFLNTKVLDNIAVQNGVQQVLTQDFGLKVNSVTCAEGMVVQTGSTYQCDAIVDQAPVKIPITITSSEGNYEVGRPL